MKRPGFEIDLGTGAQNATHNIAVQIVIGAELYRTEEGPRRGHGGRHRFETPGSVESASARDLHFSS